MIPIIAPAHSSAKECIVVSGKKYCEDVDISSRQIGCALILTVFVFAYAAGVLYLEDRKIINGWGILALFLGPLFILGLILIIAGANS